MKKFFSAFLFIVIFQTSIVAQWYYLNPITGYDPLQSIKFVDENTGYCVGSNGLILKTYDGGSNWINLSSGVNCDLYAISVLNTDIAIAVGDSGTILKSVDGGLNWYSLPKVTNEIFKSVYFVNENVGFISGPYRFILKTIDGGNNWDSLGLGNYITDNIQFIDENVGYLAASGEGGAMFLKTVDGGITWEPKSIQLNQSPSALYFLNDTTGYYCTHHYLYKTSDAGNNWNLMTHLSDFYIYSVLFFNSDIGYLVGSEGIYKTTNGGSSWQNYSIFNETFNDVIFHNINTGFVVGDNGTILKTTNAGITWVRQTTVGISATLNTVFFCNEFTGFAGGIYGDLYKTTNGGNDWIVYNPGAGSNLRSIYFTDTLNGFALCGSNIINSTDGGITWVIKHSNPDLNSIYFVNHDTGFATGWGGLILRTTNHGDEWSNLQTGFGDNFTTVFFVDANNGFVCGSNKVLKTTDLGEHWSAVLLNTDFRINCIFFNDADNGCLGGYWNPNYHAGLYQTTNGGMNWEYRYGGVRDIVSIYFADHNIGYAVDAGGYIFRTNNGGATWNTNWVTNGYGLTSVFFPSPSVGYVVGTQGTILKTGVTPVEIITFVALVDLGKINLSWSTASEINNQGFEIERSTNKNDWIKIGFKEGKGTTTEQKNYSYTDDVKGINVPKLFYRLKQIDFDGSYEYSDVVEVAIAPLKFSLSQNYPNPFNPGTKISWQSPVGSHQTLKVYDVLGREVATLINDYREAGSYEIEFDGSQLASGVYYYQLKVGEFVETSKMILMK